MIKPLVIGHSYLLERYSTGQVLRSFFEGMCDEDFHPTIICSKSYHNDVRENSLRCRVIPCFDCQAIRYIVAAAKRIIAPDFAFLPDYTYFSWAKISAIKKTIQLVEEGDYDYIHSISMPCSSHLVALEAKKKTGIPWIANFYDPWYDNPYRAINFSRFKERDRRYEEQIAENADLIVHTNHVICKEWIDRYGESIKKKIYVLPLVFREPDVKLKGEEKVLRQFDENFPFTISHIGSLYSGRDSSDFIKAIKLFITKYPQFRDVVRINYVGTVPESDKVLVTDCNLDKNFNYAGFIGENECIKYFLQSDVFLAIDGKNARDIFFPSKIMKYFYYGKPILGLTPKNSVLEQELIHSKNYVYRNDDYEGIANFLYNALTRYDGIAINDKEYWKNYSNEKVILQYRHLVCDTLLNKR